MKIAIDTNAYVDFCKGIPDAVTLLRQAEQIFVPYVVLGELRGGFLCGTKGLQNERLLARFLNSPRVTLLFPDEETTHYYARIFQQLKKQGTPIPSNDLWLAALVWQHHLHLFSKESHFRHLLQLVIVNP
ncbi:MAG: type II toxin-antitoxin system VapC family toxin [Deltaproteobacteria bacterium]|nr:type II toxin-antitoxin system VapC family toxin [Deltaproteobacteria bacterium]